MNLKNLSWTFLGNAIFAFSQWFVVFLITKLSNTEFLGKFTSIQAITAPVFLCLSFSFRTVIGSDSNRSFKESNYFTVRFFSSILAVLISLLSFLLKGHIDSQMFFIILFFSLAKFIETFSDLIYGYYQRDKVFKRFGISLILRGGFNCILSFIAIYFINDAWFVLSFLISWLIVFYFFDFRAYKSSFIFSSDKGQLYKLIKDTSPLAFNLLLISIATNVQRYLVEYYLNYKALGILAGIMYFNVVGVLFVSSISQTIISDLSDCYLNQKVSQFWKNLSKVIIPIILISLFYFTVTLVFGRTILKSFYNKDFLNYSNLFSIAALISFPAYINSALGYALTAIKVYKSQIYITVANITANLVFGIFLIKNYGLIGAMYSTLIGASIQMIMSLIILYDRLKRTSRNYSV